MAKRYELFSVKESTGQNGEKKNFWTKVGAGFENKDGSFSLILDALPVDGKLQMRLPKERDERDGGGNRGGF